MSTAEINLTLFLGEAEAQALRIMLGNQKHQDRLDLCLNSNQAYMMSELYNVLDCALGDREDDCHG